jgi:choline dehydrogenase-like flavoprotein
MSPPTPTPRDGDAFDFVIVGGGTAGCLLANRLSASGAHRVLVLEAGGEPDGRWIPIPAGFGKLLVDPRFNWRFATTPEPGTRERAIAVPRGKGLGGSTLINGMIWVRGQPGDYDAWRDDAGARGWGWDDVAPTFRAIERWAGGDGDRDNGRDDGLRGRDGPMHVEPVRERYPIAAAFLDAAREAGQRRNDDYNGADQEGFGWYQVNQCAGRRFSAYDAWLAPARHRANLTVLTGAHVTALDFDGTRCTGVTVRRGGVDTRIVARRETILAAGAVQSPQLLELSGIGDPARLLALGIPVRHALPGVGEHYLDHYATRMNWRVRGTVTLNEMSRGWRLVREVAKYFAQRRGILTLGTGLVHGFVKTRPELPTPDAQWFFVHASYADASKRILDRAPGMTIGVTQLRPQSTGSIHARSRDPFDAPDIRPNFLSAEVDQRCLVDAMKLARHVVGQPAMRRYVDHEMNPGPQVVDDADWLAFARANGQTIYHPMGTCRMGEDAGAVVDSRLKVHGLAGLRVIDASVMPRMVSGNCQAAVMMVAERGAGFVVGDAA